MLLKDNQLKYNNYAAEKFFNELKTYNENVMYDGGNLRECLFIDCDNMVIMTTNDKLSYLKKHIMDNII
jgi:hypothetical protein